LRYLCKPVLLPPPFL